MATERISTARLKSLLAAEAFCQAARSEYVNHGIVTARSWPWLDQWMRRSGDTKYGKPKPVHPIWCGSCLRRHIAGEHDQ